MIWVQFVLFWVVWITFLHYVEKLFDPENLVKFSRYLNQENT